MFKRVRFYFIISIFAILLAVSIPWQTLFNYVKFEFINKSDLIINFSLVNPEVTTLSADSENKLVLKVEVRDADGVPVPAAHVKLSADNAIGIILPSDVRTDKFGECLVTYMPPEHNNDILSKGFANVHLNASIYKSNVNSQISIKLSRVPIILIHGYQSDGSVFTNFMEFLSTKGYSSSAFKYSSEDGVVKGADTLNDYLQTQKMHYLSQGIQVKRFDIIAHSMGGLVTRYYTCSSKYVKNNDIRKILFVSVPQKGSHWAQIGEKYFHDKGIKDLIPENDLFTTTFPSMLNKGLNDTIQVGSILGQNDEVVSPESASLEEWSIKTDLYDLGGNNFNVNNLLTGSFSDATNHMGIISNKKVFEKIKSMLSVDLPYPKVKNR